ncbi:tRNA (guanosine(18)-2'-O)-methyltransferase TrmH [Gynuella sunshinyii]|uniref:tRNA (guanosine(18)-2'-O)-methyltransferase n=1 Tax=Gynuella sunshinyii YC6258 TaxID=1445510 RepID=A0A0C5V6Z1_9GAMM|nr:tRNA (guanosine(18)-2'-O)-methyltransferase TrmH [Gynuella sunshinyii]AJQ95185.1 rRNA methylase [Gynuella sunshinyii YC6258]
MTPERFHKIKSVLQHRQTSLTVVTDGVHKTQNLSALLRTADAVGLDTVHVSLDDKGQYQLHRRTSGGSGQWVDVVLHEQTTQAVSTLRNSGFTICAAHFSAQATNYYDYDFSQPTAIILGAEKPGISDEIAHLADHHLIIPMFGMVESYNVSVAAAIILSEAMRQRVENDLYNQNQMTRHAFDRKLFRWCYPKLADFCDSNNIAYPALDKDGGIIYSEQWTQNVKAINQRE